MRFRQPRNVGRVDHHEHYARGRPKSNGGYKLIVRSGTTANKKEKNRLPRSPATSESEKISFNQLNRQTGHRIKYLKVDADTGEEVPNEDIVKGYMLDKDTLIEVTKEELENVARLHRFPRIAAAGGDGMIGCGPALSGAAGTCAMFFLCSRKVKCPEAESAGAATVFENESAEGGDVSERTNLIRL